MTLPAQSLLHAALLVATLAAAHSHAQNYNYTAVTERTVMQSGAVNAGGLIWNCGSTRCDISGPWPTPGVASCGSLAAQVGRISSYGHPTNQLTPDQLRQCNQSARTVSVPSAGAIGAGSTISAGVVNNTPRQYAATFGNRVAAMRILPGNYTWNCSDRQCHSEDLIPGNEVMRECQGLVRQLRQQMATFGTSGQPFSATQLRECNSVWIPG